MGFVGKNLFSGINYLVQRMLDNQENSQNLFLLQVDLTNHTKWLMEKVKEKHFARKEFAQGLINQAKDYDFKKLFWNGDGGCFYCELGDRKNFDFVVELADKIYDLFETWKEDYRNLDTQSLDLRVSAEIALVFTDEDPSFWTSYGLNRFIKDERIISKNGFAINEKIKDRLSDQKSDRFLGVLVIGLKESSTWFCDSIHKVKEENQQFFDS